MKPHKRLLLGSTKTKEGRNIRKGHHAVAQNKRLLLGAAKTKELGNNKGPTGNRYEPARDKTVDVTSDTQEPTMSTRP